MREVRREAQVHDDILDIAHQVESDIIYNNQHTMGSIGTGRAEICVNGSGPTPAACIVQEAVPLTTQVIYP